MIQSSSVRKPKKSPKKLMTYRKIADHYGLAYITVYQTSQRNGWKIEDLEGLRQILNFYHAKYTKKTIKNPQKKRLKKCKRIQHPNSTGGFNTFFFITIDNQDYKRNVGTDLDPP